MLRQHLKSLVRKGERKVLFGIQTAMDLAIVCSLSMGSVDTVELELQRTKNFCWGFSPCPNIFLCLFWYLSVVHWATSKKTGLQHLLFESLVPLLKWINQFLMPDIKTLTKCMWLSTPLILAIVLN